MSLSHFVTNLVFLGSLSILKTHLYPSFNFLADVLSYCLSISTQCFFLMMPSIRWSAPVPPAAKHPHNMMLPPPNCNLVSGLSVHVSTELVLLWIMNFSSIFTRCFSFVLGWYAHFTPKQVHLWDAELSPSAVWCLDIPMVFLLVYIFCLLHAWLHGVTDNYTL